MRKEAVLMGKFDDDDYYDYDYYDDDRFYSEHGYSGGGGGSFGGGGGKKPTPTRAGVLSNWFWLVILPAIVSGIFGEFAGVFVILIVVSLMLSGW